MIVELNDDALTKPAGCSLCGSTMGLVPSVYGPVCMECVLSDKQVGRIVRVCFSRCLATVAVGRFLPDLDLSAILNMST